MPELPEVETVCRGLAKVVLGQRISSVLVRHRMLRIPVPPTLEKKLRGRVITHIKRRAKYIIMNLDNDQSAIWHLGMSGSMTIAKNQKPVEKHDHIIFKAGKNTVTFNDPRRFGLVTMDTTKHLARNKLFRHLGPEPLEKNFSAEYLARKLKGKKIAIKLAIMDQKTVVGVGNIYASEALFHAKIDPRRKAGSLKAPEIRTLVNAIRKVLRQAIAAGGSSLRDYVQASGELGYFQHKWAVYDKKGNACPRCVCSPEQTGGIKRIIQGGRATFYCPVKQH